MGGSGPLLGGDQPPVGGLATARVLQLDPVGGQAGDLVPRQRCAVAFDQRRVTHAGDPAVAAEWVARLLDSTADIGSDFNIGPSALIGSWWLIVGIPLGIWLTWRGRIGLAGLAVSPYVLPYYLLIGVLELVPMRLRR